MKQYILALCLLGCAGCPEADSVTYQDTPMASVRIGEYQWRQHGFELTCSDTVLNVATASADAINYACNVDTGGSQLLGCLVGNTIVIEQGQWDGPHREYVFQHELRHWLASCSKYPASPDGAHAIEAVWYPYNGYDLRYPSTWR